MDSMIVFNFVMLCLLCLTFITIGFVKESISKEMILASKLLFAAGVGCALFAIIALVAKIF